MPETPLIRAFQWDLARQVERLDWLLAQLPRYAAWGYQELYLHLEDAVEYPSLPGVARKDAYSYRQIAKLVSAASRAGINVVPIVNLLGHTQYLIKTPGWRDLNELRAPDGSPLERGQICPLHPRTLEVAEKLLRDTAPFCTAGKVHVGLDESFSLGRHPLSRTEIARIGLAAHFAGHVNRLHALTQSLGLRMGMWADMLYFIPEAIPHLPRGIIAYDWYYYPFNRHPRAELFNFAERDLVPALTQQGIEYWGCPMNGSFRHEPMPAFGERLANIRSWWKRCERTHAAGMLITSWEPQRLAQELTTVVDAAAAQLWLAPEKASDQAMLTAGFGRVFGNKYATAAARAALQADRFPFGGYPRWQINDRWDVISRREPLTLFQQEEKTFRRLAKIPGLPSPLSTSLRLRHSLAQRDVFVRKATRQKIAPAEVAKFARSIRAGLNAARAMWARTRDPRVKGPNELIFKNDLERLKRWQGGEPVFGGPWQLCYRVENFAPCAQLVAVEQKQADGTWTPLQGCHTIEFQAGSARRAHGLTREHAAPVVWDGDLPHAPHLRFVLRGVGQVRLSQVALISGQLAYPLTLKRKILGRRAPSQGFPELDWKQNQSILPCTFTVEQAVQL